MALYFGSFSNHYYKFRIPVNSFFVQFRIDSSSVFQVSDKLKVQGKFCITECFERLIVS